MKKRRIAIDMDDVLAATGKKILAIYNHQNGTNFTENDFLNKEYFDVFDPKLYASMRNELFKKGFFSDVSVLPNAIEIVRKLHEKYEIFIVSAAMEFPNSLIEKYEWLQVYFPMISWKNIVFCGDKSIISADILIDDHPKNLASFEGQSLMFDAIHNQKVSDYQRVMHWKEIEAILL